jgi:cell division protein FtsW
VGLPTAIEPLLCGSGSVNYPETPLRFPGTFVRRAVTILVFCVAALMSLGLVMLYSSGMWKAGAHYFLMQSVWCLVGIALCVVAASTDYSQLKKIAIPLLIVAVILLVLVLVPGLGIKVKGARRWLGYGPVRFQCSELAKLAVIIGIALYCEHYQRHLGTFKRGILIPAVLLLPILALIFVEKDRGATILLAAVSGTMLIVAGVRWRFLLPPIVAGAAALTISILCDPVRSKRIASWLNPEETKLGDGWQAYQASIALGAGGWTGLGLGNGRQKFGFVPEHHNDFILSMVGEELGLIATLLVVVAFIVIILCGLYISLKAPDTFGLLLGCGITFLIGFQAFINIGVVTSTLPNKGLPLPFISYGGSNLLIMLANVGLLLSIARKAKLDEMSQDLPSRDQFAEANPFKESSRKGRSGLPETTAV